MIAEINGVISSARALTDLVKANKSLANFNELGAAIAEVTTKLLNAQSAILTAQEKQATLSQRIGELEKEIVELKDWNREAERYQLTETKGVHVYSPKPGMENGEPPHSLCTNCYGKKEKSILQSGPKIPGTPPMLRCVRCQGTYFLSRV